MGTARYTERRAVRQMRRNSRREEDDDEGELFLYDDDMYQQHSDKPKKKKNSKKSKSADPNKMGKAKNNLCPMCGKLKHFAHKCEKGIMENDEEKEMSSMLERRLLEK